VKIRLYLDEDAMDDLEEMADRSEFLSDWPDTIDA